MPTLFTSGELARMYQIHPRAFSRFAYTHLQSFGFRKGVAKLYTEAELPAIEIELRRAGLITTRPGAPLATA